jgi:hypothetical protein
LAQEQPTSIEVSDAKRARGIHTIALALAAKKQRRVRRRWAFGLVAAVAASVIAAIGVRKLSSADTRGRSESVSAMAKPNGNGATLWGLAGSQVLQNAARLQQGGRLVAGKDGGATVRLSTGTELTVEHDTTLAFESANDLERFFLSQGVLRAQVAKLADGQRFIVRTDDAEVEVRGTAFRVEIVPPDAACGNGTRTRVSVSEGLVEVRGAGASTYLHPGQSWPLDCAVPSLATTATPASRGPLALDEASAPVTAVARHPMGLSESKRTPSDKAPSSPAQPSSIAQENELFSRATAARRGGDNAAAIGSFEQLITRYPTSPLAESAAVQRMTLLAHVDPAAARDAARQYLALYPQGYAKADAQKLLAQR